MCLLLAFCVGVSLVVGAYKHVNFLKLNKTFMRKIASKMNNEQQTCTVQQTIKETH